MDLTLLQGDVVEMLQSLPSESVNCCVTSPPYWKMRDYHVNGQIGLEPTCEDYVDRLTAVFRDVRRVLKKDGTLWLNMGDGFFSGKGQPASLKPKDLVGMPWRLALKLQSDGWWLRADVVWDKPNAMPDGATNRPSRSHEYVFLLTKSDQYYYNADAVREEAKSKGRKQPTAEMKTVRPNDTHWHDNRYARGASGYGVNPLGRNRRSVWTIPNQLYKGAHFATFPEKLVEVCIASGCPDEGVVLDPFAGSGTTGKVARMLGRSAVLIELNPDYCNLIRQRVEI